MYGTMRTHLDPIQHSNALQFESEVSDIAARRLKAPSSRMKWVYRKFMSDSALLQIIQSAGKRVGYFPQGFPSKHSPAFELWDQRGCLFVADTVPCFFGTSTGFFPLVKKKNDRFVLETGGATRFCLMQPATKTPAEGMPIAYDFIGWMDARALRCVGPEFGKDGWAYLKLPFQYVQPPETFLASLLAENLNPYSVLWNVKFPDRDPGGRPDEAETTDGTSGTNGNGTNGASL